MDPPEQTVFYSALKEFDKQLGENGSSLPDEKQKQFLDGFETFKEFRRQRWVRCGLDLSSSSLDIEWTEHDNHSQAQRCSCFFTKQQQIIALKKWEEWEMVDLIQVFEDRMCTSFLSLLSLHDLGQATSVLTNMTQIA